MEVLIFVVVVIVLGALAVDSTRAYRALTPLVNRLRGRSRGTRERRRYTGRSSIASEIDRPDLAGTMKGARDGERELRGRGRGDGA
jgi:hypothetical protein